MSKRRAELHLHQYLSPSLLGHLPRDGHLHDKRGGGKNFKQSSDEGPNTSGLLKDICANDSFIQ